MFRIFFSLKAQYLTLQKFGQLAHNWVYIISGFWVRIPGGTPGFGLQAECTLYTGKGVDVPLPLSANAAGTGVRCAGPATEYEDLSNRRRWPLTPAAALARVNRRTVDIK